VADAGQAPERGSLFERALALALLLALVVASLLVLEPFALVLLWAVFIAVTLWPLQVALSARLGGRERIAAGVLVLGLLLVLVVPATMGTVAAVRSMQAVSALLSDPSTWKIPAAPGWVADLPVVGDALHKLWTAAREDAARTVETYREPLGRLATWALERVLGVGRTLLKLLLALVITWPMLASGRRGADLLHRLADRVGGGRVVRLLDQGARTIRAVSVGVIGTALLASLLQAGGLAVARVPFAPLLGVVSFVLATMQVGTTPVWLGAALWLAHGGQVGWAAFTVAWGLALNAAVGNVLQPLLISRGTGLPLTVIFLGVVGGLLTWGLVGVFLGPAILGVAWTLLRTWLAGDPATEAGSP